MSKTGHIRISAFKICIVNHDMVGGEDTGRSNGEYTGELGKLIMRSVDAIIRDNHIIREIEAWARLHSKPKRTESSVSKEQWDLWISMRRNVQTAAGRSRHI